MPDAVTIYVNGRAVNVPAGTLATAALALAGIDAPRRSVCGTPRGPMCGMGICFECCAKVNGRTLRTCQTVCRQDMEIRTDDDA
jgi:D-hydroxyproline dehydrogenase subunit gamma